MKYWLADFGELVEGGVQFEQNYALGLDLDHPEGGNVLLFSKKFIETHEKYESEGYKIVEARVEYFLTIDPEQFEKGFIKWVQALVTATDGEVVAIDGKTIRGSKSRGKKSPFHIVSSWASDDR